MNDQIDNGEPEEELFGVFTIGNQAFPNKLKEHLDIRTKHINDSFCDHAELFSWYATAYEIALDIELNLKEELARTYAHIDAQSRTNLKAAGMKTTEKMVENTVITDSLYTQVQSDYLDAKRNTGLLKAAREAMIHKKELLIQLGASYRAEGQADISLKEEIYKGNT